MDLTWLAALGVLLLVAGLCTLAYDTVRRKQDSNPYPFPDNATNLLDETAVQAVKPKPQPQPQAAPPTTHVSSGSLSLPQLPVPVAVGGALKRLRLPRMPGPRVGPGAQPGGVMTRVLLAVPRRALVLIVMGSLALIAMSVAILAAGAPAPREIPGAVVVGITRFQGQPQGADLGGSLADYVLRSASAGGMQNIVVRASRLSPVSADAAEVERARLSADFLLWGDYGPSGAVTMGVALSPQFRLGVQPWQTFGEPDVGALVLPQHSLIYLPEGKGTDPMVPLTLALVRLQMGDYAAAVDAAWGSQATLDELGASGQFARLVEAVARTSQGDYEGSRAAVDAIDAAGYISPEALVVRAADRLYLQDYAGALDDASRVISDREASDRVLSRAYLLRARARYNTGELTTALNDLDESGRLDPANARVRLDRAEVFYRQAKPVEAARELDAVVKDAPNAAQAYRLMGLVRLMLAQPEDALRPLNTTRGIYSGWISGRRAEEAQAQASGDTRRAHSATDSIVSLNRELGGIALYEGMAYADIARKEPKETFFGSLWRGIRGEPTTADRALARMQEAGRLDPRRPDVPLQIGSLYTQVGDYAKAAEYLGQARDLNSTSPEPYMALARLHESQGKAPDAIATLEALVSHSPGYYPAYEQIHRLYKGLGDETSAQGALQRAVNVPAQTSEDHLWHGKFLRSLGDSNAALQELGIAAQDTELWEAHLQMGEVLLEQGRSPDALAEFQQVLTVQPNNETALLHAGRLLALAGRQEEAQTLLERLTTVVPGNVDGHLALLELLLSKGELDRAAEEGRRAVAAGNERADTHFYLGTAYDARGDWPQATSEYSTALERDPNYFQALLNLARSLYNEDRYADSIGASDKAIVMRADDPQPYRWKAEAQLALGDVDGALSSLGESLRLRPTDAEALALTARTYAAKGDEASALGYAQQAISVGPNHPVGYLALGEIHLSAGRAEDALQAFGTAVELADRWSRTLAAVGQGRAYVLQGDKTRALQTYSEASSKNPVAGEPHLYAGMLYSEAGRWDDALREYRSAVQVRPNWPLALYYLGRAYLQRKDLPNAQAAFARSVTYSPGMVDAWFGLGLAQRDQGHAKEAIEALTQATALNGNYAEAWLYLGLTYEETGDRGRAAEAFTHAYDTSGDDAVRRQAEEGLNRVR